VGQGKKEGKKVMNGKQGKGLRLIWVNVDNFFVLADCGHKKTAPFWAV